MQDVLAKLKEIQENYDNEDIQRAIAAAEKTAVIEEETVEEATDEVVDEAEEDNTYTVVHAKHGKEEIKAPSSYAAAKKFADMKKLKSTAGVDVHLHTKEDDDHGFADGAKLPKDMSDQELRDWLKRPMRKGPGSATWRRLIRQELKKRNLKEDDAHLAVEEVHEEEVVEESVDNSDLERMIRLAGRGGVLGMSKPSVIVNESVEVEEAMDDDEEEDEIEEGSGDAPVHADADADDKRFDDAEEEEDEEGDVDMEETVEVPVHALQELMRLAGYEEYKIDEYANEPEENYSSAEDQMDLGGGLNGPKKAYAAAAGGDNPMQQEPTEIEEESKLTFEGMYKRYMQEVVNETLEDKE